MLHNPTTHCRSSIRLRRYDYSQAGRYFVMKFRIPLGMPRSVET